MLYVPKKKALTFQIFNVVEYANKPTLTPKVFSNSLLQQLIIYSVERKTHTSKPTVGFYFQQQAQTFINCFNSYKQQASVDCN